MQKLNNMMIDEKIADVCRSIDGLTYHFNDWTRANVALDNAQMPVLLNLLPVAGETIIKNGTVRESRDCLFALLDTINEDPTAAEQLCVVSRMREYKLELIKAINDSQYFEPIDGSVRDSVVIDKLDVAVSGVVVELRLKERDGRCIGQ